MIENSLYQDPKAKELMLGIIDSAIAISGADFGNIQIVDTSAQELRIVAQRGFPQYWLDYWEVVTYGQGTCGAALENGGRVIVEDVTKSPLFTGATLDVMLRAGIHAVQSTPLVNREGNMIGIFSTHYKKPFVLNQQAERLLDIFARQAVDTLELIFLKQKLTKREEQLSQAVTIRDVFMSMASHELKTPLTSIKIATQMGKRLLDIDKLNRDSLNHIFGNWLEQIEIFENLINDMTDITAISQGKFKINRKMIDVHEIVNNVIGKFSADVLYQGMPSMGFWDPYRLEQILTNLLTNAIKYGKGKPVKVEQYTDEANRLIIRVIDQGIGISDENKYRIFQKFERVNYKDIVGGLGLGLYIVRQIVAAKNGEIRVESKVGEGSTFTVILPVMAQDAA